MAELRPRAGFADIQRPAPQHVALHLLKRGAEAGLRYVCDWANDDQPYPLETRAGTLVSLPAMLDLDDVNALWDRFMPIDAS